MSFFFWGDFPVETVILVACLTLDSLNVLLLGIQSSMIWILLKKRHWRLSFWTRAIVFALFCSLGALSLVFRSLLWRNAWSCGSSVHSSSYPDSAFWPSSPATPRHSAGQLRSLQSDPVEHPQTPANKLTVAIFQSFRWNFCLPISKYQKTYQRRRPSFSFSFQLVWLTWVQAQQYLDIAVACHSSPAPLSRIGLGDQSRYAYPALWRSLEASLWFSLALGSSLFGQSRHKLP